MISRSTVFVIGAGASAELGFPTGANLLRQIANSLDFDRSRFDGQFSGRGEILNAFARIEIAQDGWNQQDFTGACRRLREAAVLGRSIDNVIDQNDDNQLIEIAGKLAIALCLSEAESNSVLRRVGGNPWHFSVQNIVETWLYPFSQIITTDVRKSDLRTIFSNITIINFNYDRSIEAALPSILAANYGLTLEEAGDICGELNIVHPYGQIGELPAIGSHDGFAYGDRSADRLHEVIPSLQTFTEQIESGEELHFIKRAMQHAQRVVYLGFGYHRQNLELLTPSNPMNASEIIGTVYREPLPAVNQIRNELGAMVGRPDDWPSVDLSAQKSNEFLFDYFRKIAS